MTNKDKAMIIRSRVASLKLVPVALILSFLSCSAVFAGKSEEALSAVLDAQSAEHKSRYGARHPQETLAFFGVTPGMTVAEILPGGGWYTKILAPYVGDSGAIYGVNYADEMWPMFGIYDEKAVAGRIAATAAFPAKMATYPGAAKVPARGFAFGSVPKDAEGTVDVVVMVRALHNLNRFEAKIGTRTQALKDLYKLLKPGGVVGVVQHRAPESANDSWADGSRGYLKQSAVVAMFEQQGFSLAASSEVNANSKDKPTAADFVWRLPPTLAGPKEGHAAMKAIGESDRMTLKFVKK